MRILHLISQHPEATGSGFSLQNVLRQAARAGHRNYLIAGLSGNSTPQLAGVEPGHCRFVRFESAELPFVIPGMSDVMPYRSSRFSALPGEAIVRYEAAFSAAVSAMKANHGIDLIHSHHLWLATAAARRSAPELALVTSCHSTELRQFVNCPQLGARILPDCRAVDMVLALDSAQRDRIRDLYGIDEERIRVVGAGFDGRFFSYGVKPTPPPVRFLYAGKLSLAKGVDWLLRVMAELGGAESHLHIAGSGHGEEEKLCRHLADRLGSRATLHGSLNQAELGALMRVCHVFVLPSFYEGLPLVLLEALASGCRIVATDLPGCRQLLAPVPPESAELLPLPQMANIDRPASDQWPALDRQLAEALRRMTVRVGEKPSPTPEETVRHTAEYGWEQVFSRISAAYEAALQARGRG